MVNPVWLECGSYLKLGYLIARSTVEVDYSKRTGSCFSRQIDNRDTSKHFFLLTLTTEVFCVLAQSFLWHLSKTMLLWVQYRIFKIVYRFWAKPKELDPVKLVSLRQTRVSIALKYIINNNVLNRIRASMIATLSFFIENIHNRYIVLLAQWYTNLLLPDAVHPQISSSLRLLVFALFVKTRSSYITICLLFQRTHFFHWLHRQMAHQYFQCFDSSMLYNWCYFVKKENTRNNNGSGKPCSHGAL